jgi:hypothetical protein
MEPVIVTITGSVIEFGDIYELSPGRKAQRILIQCNYTNVKIKTDTFAVFVFGADIWKLVENYKTGSLLNQGTFTCKLNGRMKDDRNTLTLTFKKVEWKH